MRVAVIVLIVVLGAVGFWFFSRSSEPIAIAEGPSTSANAEPTSNATPAAKLESVAQSSSPERVATESEPIASSPTGKSNVDPKRVCTIVGRVIDEHGAPFAGAEIVAKHDKRHLETCGADGRFSRAVDADPNASGSTSEMTAASQGFVPRTFEFVLKPGETTDVGDIVLIRGGRVSGRVVDERSLAVADARVVATPLRELYAGEARRGQFWDAIAETKSDALGAFLFDGLPPGHVRLFANREHFVNAVSEPVEVRPADETRDVVLTLAPEAADDFFDITVVEPDGTPSGGANVGYNYHGASESGSGGETADANGHLHFVAMVKGPHSFHAEDRAHRFGPSVTGDLLPGVAPIVMRLTEKRTIALEVVDEHDKPLTKFGVTVERTSKNSRSSNDISVPDEQQLAGRAEVPVPGTTFDIRVTSPGHAYAELGPFEPDAAPTSLRAVLANLNGISGRVVNSKGEAIVGAELALADPVDPKRSTVVNGFQVERSFRNGSAATTDAQGEFIVFPETSGECWLRAEKSGFAAAIVGPIAFDAGSATSGVELVLSDGGTIEGRLLLPTGENTIGAIIGASFGDGFARTVRTDADGRFRFERLTPGRWLVKRCDEEISPNRTTSSTRTVKEPVELPWNCVVRDGATTHFDLDLRVDARPRIVGRLAFGGKPASGWRLEAVNLGWQSDGSTNSELDHDGRFDVRVAAAGASTLRFSDPSASDGFVQLTVKFDAHTGENSWERDFPVGSIDLVRTTEPDPGEHNLWLGWSEGDSISMGASVELSAESHYKLAQAPAGSWTVSGDRDGAWTQLANFQVVAGQVANASVP